MKKYKREEKIYSSIANFLIIGTFLKYIFSFAVILISTLAFLKYQNNAYDHIRVVAHSQNQDSFFAFLDKEKVSFSLTLKTDDQQFDFKNISTPYSIRIPHGDRIKVKLDADSKFICAKLKSARSSAASSLKKEMSIERIGNQFKINS